MGRWSRAIGEIFLGWLAPPAGARWLDVGSGTGAFSELISRRCAPRSLTGIDPSAAQVEYASKVLPSHSFEVADSMALPFADASFDVVASALVIHFIPDRAKAFAEMHRVLGRGGLAGGYTWKREGLREFAAYAPMIDGIAAIGVPPPHSTPVPESSVDGMRSSLAAAGFVDADAIEVTVSQAFPGFDEYWSIQTVPFSRAGQAVASLSEAQRARLRDHLRETLVAADGSITYTATAVAGRARKP
jgi:SAM-dependent methyltransferase